MPSKRAGRLVLVLALAAAAAALFGLRQQLGRFAFRRVLAALGTAVKGRVSCERISGDAFAHPRVVGLRVQRGEDSVVIDSVDLRYDLVGMLRGRLAFADVVLHGPVVFLGSQRQPGAASVRSGPVRFPRAAVERLIVRGGRVFVDHELRADSLDLALRLGAGPERLQAQLVSVRARLVRESLQLRNVSALCIVTPDSVRLADCQVLTGASRLRGDLQFAIADHGLRAKVSDLRLSLPEFTSVPGRVSFRGAGLVRDSLRQVRGHYEADSVRLGELALPGVVGQVNLDGDQLGLSLSGSDARLGDFAADASINIRTLTYSARAVMGGCEVRALVPSLPSFHVSLRLSLSGARFDSVRFDALGSADDLGVETMAVCGSYSRGRVAVEHLEAAGRAGRLSGFGFWADSLGSADVRVESLDARLLGQFVKLDMAGRLSGELRCRFGPRALALAGSLRAGELSTRDFGFGSGLAQFDLAYEQTLQGNLIVGLDSVYAAGVSAEGAQLSLDSGEFFVRVDLPKNRLRAAGHAEVSAAETRLAVRMLEFATERETMDVTKPFAVELRAETLRVSDFATRVAGGELGLDISRRGSALPEVHLRARQVDLAHVAALVQLSESLAGTVDLSVNGRDTLAVDLTAERLAVPAIGLKLSSAAGRFSLQPGRLAIDRLGFVGADSALPDSSSISGSVGFDMAAGLRLTNLDLRAMLRNPGPWVFFFLQPTFAVQQGLVYGDVTVRGDPAAPTLGGRVRVSRGLIRMPDLNADVERLAAELTFSGRRINLQKISGRAGKGSVVAIGLVDIGRNWQVDSVVCSVELSGASVNPQPEVFAVGSGSLRIGWSPTRPLAVSGDVQVDEALLAFGFGEPTVPAAGPDTMVLYDVRVHAERNVWLRNQLADVEFSGDLGLRKTRTDVVYSGELVSRQGALYYLDHTLRVTSGTVRFENINRLDPDLALAAEMPIRSAARDSSGRVPERVVITVSGTLEKPSLTLGSEPAGWGAEQIASYLSLNVTPDELSAMDQKEAVTRLLSERLLGYFQTQVSKRARGFASLDYLEFESGLLTGLDTKVTVGKYVGRNLYIAYTQNFSGDFQPAFRVEYYLDRRNELLAERTEAGRYSLRYRFKLRY
jgi:autotransporter translocation and assembly factor TamB